MILKLQRFFDDGESTLGTLSLDKRFLCFTLEDSHHEQKIPGKTRIPSGIYDIDLRTEGGLQTRYANRFPDFHEGMVWIRNVPNFSFIYFHIGNDSDDTSGCILTGDRCDPSVSGLTPESRVLGSGDCYRRIYPTLLAVAKSKNGHIIIKDDWIKNKVCGEAWKK